MLFVQQKRYNYSRQICARFPISRGHAALMSTYPKVPLSVLCQKNQGKAASVTHVIRLQTSQDIKRRLPSLESSIT